MSEEMKTSEKSPFSKLHHVTIVVKNIERAVKFYSSLGIGPFESYPSREYTKRITKDELGTHDLRIRQARVGPVLLQLVQPGEGENIYKDFLEKRGEGVQHLGFVVDDVDKEEAKLVKLGLKILESGRRADGSGFTYFDTDAIGGVILVIRQDPSHR